MIRLPESSYCRRCGKWVSYCDCPGKWTPRGARPTWGDFWVSFGIGGFWAVSYAMAMAMGLYIGWLCWG